MKTSFYNYAQGISPARILPFRANQVVPTQLIPKLNQFNINSTTELYNFMQANPANAQLIYYISGLYEDEFSRLQEKITEELENTGMIDKRCGPESDPCKTLPANIIRNK